MPIKIIEFFTLFYLGTSRTYPLKLWKFLPSIGWMNTMARLE